MTQLDTLYSLLSTGPKTREQLVAGGVSEYELRARISDLRRRIHKHGCEILHRREHGTWELVVPV